MHLDRIEKRAVFSFLKGVIVNIEGDSELSTVERDISLNEQRRRTIASQASGEYLMNHIAGVMDMVQDRAFHGDTLDEETLVVIEAQVKAIAEELIHQEQEQRVGVPLTKKVPLLAMQRQRELADDERSR